MADMYSTIMDLPLFKGISRAQVSTFLEKTSIEFLNYEPEDALFLNEEINDYLFFIISGKVTISWTQADLSDRVEFSLGQGAMLGGAWLFGLNRATPFSAVAQTKTSVLRVSKTQYMSLIESSKVYLLNYLNYLSLMAQRANDALKYYSANGVYSTICRYLMILTPADASDIIITLNHGSTEPISNTADFLHDADIAACIKQGFLKLNRDNEIMILSRSGVLQLHKHE